VERESRGGCAFRTPPPPFSEQQQRARQNTHTHTTRNTPTKPNPKKQLKQTNNNTNNTNHTTQPTSYELLNTGSGKIEVKHLTAEQAKNSEHFKDKESGAELEVQEKLPLLEWMANNYKKFGCGLEFVTNKSQEGSQFCRGFGGIGGVLRYQVNMAEFEEPDDDGGSGLWSDDDF
jgi:hypothetical protein